MDGICTIHYFCVAGFLGLMLYFGRSQINVPRDQPFREHSHLNVAELKVVLPKTFWRAFITLNAAKFDSTRRKGAAVGVVPEVAGTAPIVLSELALKVS
jgi:hypothetical protein